MPTNIAEHGREIGSNGAIEHLQMQSHDRVARTVGSSAGIAQWVGEGLLTVKDAVAYTVTRTIHEIGRTVRVLIAGACAKPYPHRA